MSFFLFIGKAHVLYIQVHDETKNQILVKLCGKFIQAIFDPL